MPKPHTRQEHKEYQRQQAGEEKKSRADECPDRTDLPAVEWMHQHYPISRRLFDDEEVLDPWLPKRYLADMVRVLEHPARPTSIALWKGAQLGFTQTMLGYHAYCVFEKVQRVLIVMPNNYEATDYNKSNVDPIYTKCKLLKGLKESTSYLTAVKGRHKTFDTGAESNVQGGGTPARYRSKVVQVQCLDELDGYEQDIGGEGDPFTLSTRAVRNSGGLLIAGSTPTEANGPSQIIAAWRQAAVKFVYCVRCPLCHELDWLEWERFEWDKEGDLFTRAASVRFKCRSCGDTWTHDRLDDAIEAGRWQEAEVPEEGYPPPNFAGRWIDDGTLMDDGVACDDWPRSVGFAINALHSVWSDWTDAVSRWLVAQGDASSSGTARGPAGRIRSGH